MFDPLVGTGNLIVAAANNLERTAKLYGVEVDLAAYELAEAMFFVTEAGDDVYCQDTLSLRRRRGGRPPDRLPAVAGRRRRRLLPLRSDQASPRERRGRRLVRRPRRKRLLHDSRRRRLPHRDPRRTGTSSASSSPARFAVRGMGKSILLVAEHARRRTSAHQKFCSPTSRPSRTPTPRPARSKASTSGLPTIFAD
ncbi:MAG: hypothetical protein MZU95_08150 [Desulfomicrobium escambiense]|nr:hypothetical protein [Desulfomicrobium escambiense]